MKKYLVFAVVVLVSVAFASSAYCKTKVEVKAKEKGHEVWTLTKVKDKDGKEVLKTKENLVDGDVKVIDVTEHKRGDLWKDTVKVHKYKEGEDFIYVTKDDKVFRVPMKTGAKEPGLKLKKGDTINIVSTYPLTIPELQEYVMVHKVENAK